MNNRFKIRVWNKEQQKLYSWDDLKKSKGDNSFYWCMLQAQNDEKNNVLMQCTGLKDKNGKLIYEGDIVRITKKRWYEETYQLYYLVCWDRTQWQLGLFKDQRPKSQENRRSDRKIAFRNIVSFEYYTPIKYFADCEVIGNIYENKELL